MAKQKVTSRDVEKIMSRLRAAAEEAKQTKITILLVGQTGVGKSSTVNELFGEEIAPVGRHRPTTLVVEKYEQEVNGIVCRAIDTPGLCERPDIEEKDFEYLEMIKKKVDEFHVMLFVTRLDFHRITNDDIAIKRITAALGKKCWEHSLIVFTHSNSTGSNYAEDKKIRTDVIRAEIARVTTKKLGYSVPTVAVDNSSKTTPDGKEWLPELFLSVFKRIEPKAAIPYVLATATPVDPMNPESGRRIKLDEQQQEVFYEAAKEKASPESWLALTYFGTAPVALAAGAMFGPPGFVAAALGMITIGVGGWIISAIRND